jgi:multiple sugar transport system substrate-binding protein
VKLRTISRTPAAVLAVVLAAATLAACSDDGGERETQLGKGEGPVEEPSEPVEVSFLSHVGNQPQMKKLAKQFHEKYPNITIKFENVPAETAGQVLSTRIAGNNAPDVAYINASDTADYASRTALVDLDDYIERSEIVEADDYVDGFREFVEYDGSMWGLPFDGESTGLFYRTDLFEAAGIEGPPTTWEEFEAAAEALTDDASNQYGYELFASEAAYYWYPWLWQAGGEILSEDGQEVLFDSEEAIEAAEFYVGLADYSPEDYLNSNSYDGRIAFAEGQVGMYMAGAWFAGVLSDEFPDIEGKWAAAPLPEGPNGCKTTIAGDSLVMFNSTENSDAAWLWMEFLSQPEVIADWTYRTEGTLLPPLNSLLEGEELVEEKPVLEGFAELMSCGVPNVAANPKMPRIEEILDEELGKAMYGEQSAEDALRNAADQAEAILARG